MISTHVLDTSTGVPASGVSVVLAKRNGEKWDKVASGVTNTDGRHAFDGNLEAGTYQITFAVEDYLKKTTKSSFFENIPVVFKISDLNRKYHVPLLLNPFGYSTYRGS